MQQEDQKVKLHLGDCLEVLKSIPECSIESIVTDPPYGLSFMGKKWDYDVPTQEVWAECLRVLKPGGHLLAFAGTRTQHRMAVRIEDAGFEIRDMIAWVYGSGFPKSLDVSKAIDKAAGAKREVVGKKSAGMGSGKSFGMLQSDGTNRDANKVVAITAPATPAAQKWNGWGTALKPALEPITLARKPLSGTVAANVLAYGCGAVNVDGCRVGSDARWNASAGNKDLEKRHTVTPISKQGETEGRACVGRWPANLIHDGSDEVVAAFTSTASSGGGAVRFFYCAKASKADREEGCEGVQQRHRANGNKWTDQDYRVASGERPQSAESGPRRNHHPTVKPTALMRYLCRLVTPPGGTVLDPFMGSGSTGKAAALEGFGFVGIERDADYFHIAEARIAWAKNQPSQQGLGL